MKRVANAIPKKRILAIIILLTLLIPITASAANTGIIKVKSVKMGKVATTRYVGQSVRIPLTVSPYGASNKDVNWTSSNKKVATVDQEGNVKFNAKGKVTIKATAVDGSKKSASKRFTVKQYVTGITLNQSEISIKKGKTYTLKANVKPASATKKTVQWISSNKKIATVSSKGVVKGVAKGTVTITCKAKDGSGILARCIVNVDQTAPQPTPTPLQQVKPMPQQFINLVLDGVNNSREDYGMPRVKQNETLRAAAQAWAEYMALTDDYRHEVYVNPNAIFAGEAIAKEYNDYWQTGNYSNESITMRNGVYLQTATVTGQMLATHTIQLSTECDRIGVGAAYRGNTVYICVKGQLPGW